MDINPRTLLIASQDLEDPYFKQSVILIVEHTEDHTIGLILNLPLQVTCAEIVSQFELSWHSTNEMVLHGGPVESNMLWILHSDGWPFDHNVIFQGVGLSVTKEALSVLCKTQSERVKLFSGYSGWGPGQLQREIDEGSWFMVDADADFVFDTSISQMWEEALALLGIDANLMMSSTDWEH